MRLKRSKDLKLLNNSTEEQKHYINSISKLNPWKKPLNMNALIELIFLVKIFSLLMMLKHR